ncbi:hypothetical protein KAI92_04305 [Candidatus Parcubacteria bacterium]|nr:hypothetical protein [Candidatus Parcubacteria bacterium]
MNIIGLKQALDYYVDKLDSDGQISSQVFIREFPPFMRDKYKKKKFYHYPVVGILELNGSLKVFLKKNEKLNFYNCELGIIIDGKVVRVVIVGLVNIFVLDYGGKPFSNNELFVTIQDICNIEEINTADMSEISK